MKRLLLFFACCSLFQYSFSQPYDPEKVNKKAVQFFDQAYERAQDGNYPNAIGLLLQAIKTDTKYVDAYLALGNIYGILKPRVLLLTGPDKTPSGYPTMVDLLYDPLLGGDEPAFIRRSLPSGAYGLNPREHYLA